MSDYRLAMSANEILRANKNGDRYHYVTDLAFRGIDTDDVTGRVIYVGGGHELSPLFIFENAQCFIH